MGSRCGDGSFCGFRGLERRCRARSVVHRDMLDPLDLSNSWAGDKTNHVATIHLPQMLYIWPLFAFFSAPLLLPFIQWPFALGRGTSPSVSVQKRLETQRPQKWYPTYLSIAAYASLTLVALAIVHLNTIIHPFTLADNRHYMFYVFRYTILRQKWVRYALVPAYVLCWSICWKTLGGPHPTYDAAVSGREDQQKRVSQGNSFDAKSAKVKESDMDAALSVDSPTLSTALLWVLATALSLITAPLVEPRYFILPWVFWRLLAPPWPASTPWASLGRIEGGGPSRLVEYILSVGQRYDLRLFVETAWFLAVHMVTAYMFIAKPYYWRSQDGSLLDGGRLQRFMW
jgi:alpha-1,2-glucosyltransferase